jgi:hypothetical protein
MHATYHGRKISEMTPDERVDLVRKELTTEASHQMHTLNQEGAAQRLGWLNEVLSFERAPLTDTDNDGETPAESVPGKSVSGT